MKISQVNLQVLKDLEGFRKSPYLCSAGKWTIGYGTTIYPNQKKVTSQDKPITEVLASVLLDLHLEMVYRNIGYLVKVELSQNQFDAICMFVYNVGVTRFKTSTILKLINAKLFDIASRQFDRWIWAGGKKSNGLIKRRNAEKKIFLGE